MIGRPRLTDFRAATSAGGGRRVRDVRRLHEQQQQVVEEAVTDPGRSYVLGFAREPAPHRRGDRRLAQAQSGIIRREADAGRARRYGEAVPTKLGVRSCDDT